MRILCFTKTGYQLARKLEEQLTEQTEVVYKSGKPLSEICREAFAEQIPLLFIGAMGIAVRHIAPFVKDKLSDPPVLVMDEKGLHVIPVLSGHVGGANELAVRIGGLTGAEPVLTTATDLEQAFSVDLFAKEQGLKIVNREGIAKVSVKALEGKPVTLCLKGYPPADPVDVIVTDEPALFSKGLIALSPGETCTKKYAIGIGCKKGKSFHEIEACVHSCLEAFGISMEEVFAVGTIDIKKEEEGLKEFANKYSLPLLAFEAGILEKAKGEFSPSSFVKETTGVDNVCERAAVLAAGNGSDLTVRKQACDGVTFAAALRKG